MAANNIAEIILKVTTEGQGNAQLLAAQLTQLDQATNKVMTTTLAATTAQKSFNAEIGKPPPAPGLAVAQLQQPNSQLERMLQNWGNLQKQVDGFTTHTLRDFTATSAHALTEWIEGSANAKQAFAGFVTSVLEGIIQIMLQQTIAHALGLTQAQVSAQTQTVANTEIAASAAPAAALTGAATFGANSVGVALVIAAVLGGVGALLALTRKAEGGPVFGAGSETSDSIPAWLSHNEYVQPASAHNYYGTDVMEAMRTRSIPREAIRSSMEHRTFACGGPVLPTRGFAEGGIAVRMAGGGIVPNVSVGGATVLLAFGPAEIDRLMATTEMQKHLTDHLDRNAHRVARNIKRTGGHRQE
ncbi:MAG TPA: hypothetical protein VNL17_08650 [Verrucomicrobiae bacterium]|nr:hypothetical protein [Verrucomicrobiae bacterium]